MEHDRELKCHSEKITVTETTLKLFLDILKEIKEVVLKLDGKIDEIKERRK